MKLTIEKKYEITIEMLNVLRRTMITEMNLLPLEDERFLQKVEMRKKINEVLNYLNENK